MSYDANMECGRCCGRGVFIQEVPGVPERGILPYKVYECAFDECGSTWRDYPNLDEVKAFAETGGLKNFDEYRKPAITETLKQ